MGFRFRRSFKIAPGIRWNISKTGSSWSVGPRGFTTNFRKGRVTRTIGIPSTGISYRHTLGGGSQSGSSASGSAARTLSPETAAAVSDRFGISAAYPLKRIAIIATVVCLAAAFVFPFTLIAALVFGVMSVALPRVNPALTQELERRRAQWQSELEKVRTSTSKDAPAFALRQFQALELTEEEGGPQLPVLRIFSTFYAWEKALGGTLPSIPGHEAATDGEPVFFFRENVIYDKRGDSDPTGTLYLTAERVLFNGGERLSLPWKKIASVDQEMGCLLLQRVDRQTPTRFECGDTLAGLQADFIAKNARAAADSQQSGPPVT